MSDGLLVLTGKEGGETGLQRDYGGQGVQALGFRDLPTGFCIPPHGNQVQTIPMMCRGVPWQKLDRTTGTEEDIRERERAAGHELQQADEKRRKLRKEIWVERQRLMQEALEDTRDMGLKEVIGVLPVQCQRSICM